MSIDFQMSQLRQQIDQIHLKLSDLLMQRAQLAKEIWLLKKDNGIPWIDEGREELVVQSFSDLAKGDAASEKMLTRIAKEILLANREYLEDEVKNSVERK